MIATDWRERAPPGLRRHFTAHASVAMSSSMCVVETSSAGREYKVRDMAQADFGCVIQRFAFGWRRAR
jgi:hypothetical protein